MYTTSCVYFQCSNPVSTGAWKKSSLHTMSQFSLGSGDRENITFCTALVEGCIGVLSNPSFFTLPQSKVGKNMSFHDFPIQYWRAAPRPRFSKSLPIHVHLRLFQVSLGCHACSLTILHPYINMRDWPHGKKLWFSECPSSRLDWGIVKNGFPALRFRSVSPTGTKIIAWKLIIK